MPDSDQPERFDTIIIGAGHNGLVCAAYLARAGQKVLVLEAAEQVGGVAASREFHPGFKASVAHQVSHFPAQLLADLKLEQHGLQTQPAPALQVPRAGGGLRVSGTGVTGAGSEDGAAFVRYQAMLQRFAGALAPFWLKTMPRIANQGMSSIGGFAQIGWRLRRLGKDDMREFMRVATLPMRDLVDEFFADEALKAALAWDGLIGSRMAPRSPNNAVLALLYRMATGKGDTFSAPVGSLVRSLHKAATAAGAEVRTTNPVVRIILASDHSRAEHGQTVSGVQLESGDRIDATRVVSSADPQTTFFKLLGAAALEIGFSNRIHRLRCDGLVAKLHLALSGLPDFTGLERPDGRIILAGSLDAIEFAFDHAKYGELPEQPVLEVVMPSLQDPALAPQGQHVLSAHIMYVPRKLKGGWNDVARQTLADRAMAVLERNAPGISGLVLGRQLLTPECIEQQYGSTGGHWHQTEFALDQLLMMRPTYEAAQYATPVPGLYLCGAGCHPGGDLTGAPGHNAAQAILKS